MVKTIPFYSRLRVRLCLVLLAAIWQGMPGEAFCQPELLTFVGDKSHEGLDNSITRVDNALVIGRDSLDYANSHAEITHLDISYFTLVPSNSLSGSGKAASHTTS